MYCIVYPICIVLYTLFVLYCIPYMYCIVYPFCIVLYTLYVLYCIPFLYFQQVTKELLAGLSKEYEGRWLIAMLSTFKDNVEAYMKTR